MKKFLQIGLPLLLVVSAIGGILVLQEDPVSAQSNDTQLTIEQRDVNVTVDGTGAISPERTLYLSFSVSETVADVMVVAGDSVSEGDILATLETDSLQLQVDSAQASVDGAQASLESAIQSLSNNSEQVIISCSGLMSAEDMLESATEDYADYVSAGYDVDPNFIADPNSQAGIALRDAQTNYDVTVAQCNTANNNATNNSGVDSAQAQLDNAQVQLQQSQNLLDDAQLIAPFDGLVTDVAIVEDQVVGTGTIAITLVDNSQLHIITEIDELDIASVEIGQIAEITLDALGENTVINGEVTRISPQAMDSQGITTYEVRIDLTENDPRLRLGMSADVTIQVDILTDALVVPRQAIQRNNELGEFITVRINGTDSDIAITPGYSAEGVIVVEGDIQAGQSIVIVED